jgi:hypothetical protein
METLNNRTVNLSQDRLTARNPEASGGEMYSLPES